MKIINHTPDYNELFYCDHCQKYRRIELEKDDPDLAEPNLVTCRVCLETIAIIEMV